MANNLLAQPMVINSSLATSYKSQLSAASPNAGINNTSYGTLHTLIIKRLYWENPGNSQVLNIGDPTSGEILYNMKSSSTGNDVDSGWLPEPILWQDFEINAFPGGGTLYIWYR